MQILGEPSVDVHGDSRFTYCPSSLTGAGDALQEGGDELLSFSHNTWQSYLQHGYTEYIEVRERRRKTANF